MADKKMMKVTLVRSAHGRLEAHKACVRGLGLEDAMDNINPLGGGIALGHPLGCTGAFLTCKLLGELGRRGEKYGVVSMCIGGGMGAAGVFEMC